MVQPSWKSDLSCKYAKILLLQLLLLQKHLIGRTH